jgi:hypothetical protein
MAIRENVCIKKDLFEGEIESDVKKRYSVDIKAKVALEAIKGQKPRMKLLPE